MRPPLAPGRGPRCVSFFSQLWPDTPPRALETLRLELLLGPAEGLGVQAAGTLGVYTALPQPADTRSPPRFAAGRKVPSSQCVRQTRASFIYPSPAPPWTQE